MTDQPPLFEIGTTQTKPLTCRTCIHRERHEMGGAVISYCAIRKSKRTRNGQLKITIKTPACAGFEGKTK